MDRSVHTGSAYRAAYSPQTHGHAGYYGHGAPRVPEYPYADGAYAGYGPRGHYESAPYGYGAGPEPYPGQYHYGHNAPGVPPRYPQAEYAPMPRMPPAYTPMYGTMRGAAPGQQRPQAGPMYAPARGAAVAAAGPGRGRGGPVYNNNNMHGWRGRGQRGGAGVRGAYVAAQRGGIAQEPSLLMCCFFLRGLCVHGERCCYAHEDRGQPCRYGKHCRHGHHERGRAAPDVATQAEKEPTSTADADKQPTTDQDDTVCADAVAVAASHAE